MLHLGEETAIHPIPVKNLIINAKHCCYQAKVGQIVGAASSLSNRCSQFVVDPPVNVDCVIKFHASSGRAEFIQHFSVIKCCRSQTE